MTKPSGHQRSPMMAIQSPFADAARSGIDLPMPGCGRTADRFAALRSWARTDGSLGRLAESHFDAVAILREAGRRPPEGVALAVWASESGGKLVAKRTGDVINLAGTKAFCGGASVVDAALVTAMLDLGAGPTVPILLMVDLQESGLRVDPTSWTPTAFTEAGICTVDFDLKLDPSRMIGAPGFYLDRAASLDRLGL